ncbi:uncharacterized protein BCR38DRAFT_126751 [Pseudomassariella vexata]|uniref:Uncharacterized protein n=1 Tax=Pseudomassariella vexata TaxID=1141098 RepID=A0A1Y2D7Q8_9PEZI|nr:uncharacterized protein BCR38DRAFT_126751 [Pseudomassariella vexata]ORY55308.1 hypothetical protein BCR38DRAFT_126751 [Pseudomassariella vexata]
MKFVRPLSAGTATFVPTRKWIQSIAAISVLIHMMIAPPGSELLSCGRDYGSCTSHRDYTTNAWVCSAHLGFLLALIRIFKMDTPNSLIQSSSCTALWLLSSSGESLHQFTYTHHAMGRSVPIMIRDCLHGCYRTRSSGLCPRQASFPIWTGYNLQLLTMGFPNTTSRRAESLYLQWDLC